MPSVPATDSPIRIAIAQPVMYWTGHENASAVCQTIERAAEAQARICVFPELAVTGFHRRIAEAAKPDLVERWLCSRLQSRR
jgi:predicted amidohydrolase